MPNPNTSIDRRRFIRQVSALASLAYLGSPALTARANGTYEMGLQLYTVRDPMAADPIGTLRKIAVIGYRDLETYGFDAERVSYYGFGAKELKRILDDNNLADRLNRIGEQTRKAGLGLAYHNHDFEFIRRATNTGDLPHSTRASSKAAFLAVIG